MEDIRIVFSNIMGKLLKQAHKNKNVLEYKEINDAFKNIEFAVYCSPSDDTNYRIFDRVFKPYTK